MIHIVLFAYQQSGGRMVLAVKEQKTEFYFQF